MFKTKPKNMNDLRQLLWAEIENLKSGKTTAAQAQVVVNAAGKIISSVRAELEYMKLTGQAKNIPLLTKGKKDK